MHQAVKFLRSALAFFLTATLCGLTSALAPGADATPARDFTEWTSGSGSWTNAAHWADALPNPFQRTEVHGDSMVIIPAGNFIAGDLEVGMKKGDRARVELDGGQLLLLQDSLRIGELSGGEGEFDLNDGALHCPVDVYSGAANSVPGRATKATLRIRGGSFLART